MLYAGGISRMEEGHYLNPHIDNSHDKERKRWRSLNLLYYASSDWHAANGGNLEVWPHGPKDAPVTLASQFNRLVVMSTHQNSWHSVSPIRVNASRRCVSNYYFSDHPMHPQQQFHVTSFRGRPEQCVVDAFLRGDALLRMMLRKIKSSGFFNTGHWYKR
jgi:Rps23 Pro-64 3,4-dihydroxylase Tpa1-like proline 4-hydroxylase